MTTLTESYHAGEFLISEVPRHRSRDGVIVASGADLKAGTVLGRIVAASVTTRIVGTGTGAITMDVTTPLLAGVQEGVYKAVCIEPGSNAGVFAVYDPQGVFLGNHTVAGAAFANQIKFAIADATDYIAGDYIEIYVKAGTASAITGTGNATIVLYQTTEGAQPGTYTLTALTATTFDVVAPDGVSIGTATAGTRFIGGGLDFTITAGGTPCVAGDYFTVAVTRGKVKTYNPANTDGSGSAWGVLWADAAAASADVKAAAVVRDAEVNTSELVWFTGATGAQKAAGLAELAQAGIIGRA